ncbi:MAG: hypothetical protein J5I92_03280 [Thiogranum sp.]|nr:hypothetical protein [Thiogranum sp.]
MTIKCFAQRLLNPFRGVMNIIEYQGAEAITTDGVHWDIYVRNSELVEELPNSSQVQTSDIRYGSWSEKQGLKRGAIFPSDDFRTLEQRGAIVYEYLLRHHRDIPFPLQDRLECWLLDASGRPLGLLDSAVRAEDRPRDGPLDWRAGRECCRSFRSDAMQQLAQDDGETAAGEYLTRYINACAGDPPRAQWFLREADGSGTVLRDTAPAPEVPDRTLGVEAFPPFFINEHRGSAAQRQLVRDFIAWQAPWILLLQTLTPAARADFEQHARARAVTVEKQYRLYPEVRDSEALKAMRVEAALRNNLPGNAHDDETMATYYIELNISRTN